jgi:hypothetical protein
MMVLLLFMRFATLLGELQETEETLSFIVASEYALLILRFVTETGGLDSGDDSSAIFGDA